VVSRRFIHTPLLPFTKVHLRPPLLLKQMSRIASMKRKAPAKVGSGAKKVSDFLLDSVDVTR
jgi:hypothetical protein